MQCNDVPQVALQKPKSFPLPRFLRPMTLFKTKLYAGTQHTCSKGVKKYDCEYNFKEALRDLFINGHVFSSGKLCSKEWKPKHQNQRNTDAHNAQYCKCLCLLIVTGLVLSVQKIQETIM